MNRLFKDSRLYILRRSGDNALIYRAESGSPEPYVFVRGFDGEEWSNGTYFRTEKDAVAFWNKRMKKDSDTSKLWEVITLKNGETDSTFVSASSADTARRAVTGKGKVVEVSEFTHHAVKPDIVVDSEEVSGDLIKDSGVSHAEVASYLGGLRLDVEGFDYKVSYRGSVPYVVIKCELAKGKKKELIVEASEISDSMTVNDGNMSPSEGSNMDGILYGKYNEGGRSYRGFEITSDDKGLRKGFYRFYAYGGSDVLFGNSSRDGHFTESQFQSLISEGKIKLLDATKSSSMENTVANEKKISDSIKVGTIVRVPTKGGGSVKAVVVSSSGDINTIRVSEGSSKGSEFDVPTSVLVQDSDEDEQKAKFKVGNKVVEIEVESEEREKEEQDGKVRDSNKMFKVTDKKTGKIRLVKASDSLMAVSKVAIINDAYELGDASDSVVVTLDGRKYYGYVRGKSSNYPSMAMVRFESLSVFENPNLYKSGKEPPMDDMGNRPKDGKYYIKLSRLFSENPHVKKLFG